MLKSIILGGSEETVSNSITSGDTLLNVIESVSIFLLPEKEIE